MNDSLFDNLARELSNEERMMMLDRVRSILPSEEIPLHSQISVEPVDLEKIHKDCPWYEKFIIYLMHLFTGKNILEVTEERQLNIIKRNISKNVSPWFDLEHKRIKQDFYTKLETLKKLAWSFKESLDTIENEKNDFIFFLGNQFFSDLETSLKEGINPDKILQNSPDLPSSRVKDQMMKSMEEAFDQIPPTLRLNFKLQAKAQHQLNAFVQFPFHHFLSIFQERGESGIEADWENARTALTSLSDILLSFMIFPSNRMLERIFLFANKDKVLGSTPEDMAHWLGDKFRDAGILKKQLMDITDLPLVDLLKIITGHINYNYSDIGGGEDFYPIFKKIWQNKIEKRYHQFSTRVKMKDLRQNLLSTWSIEEIPKLGRYNEKFSKLRSFRYSYSLELLSAYYNDLILEKGYPCLEIVWKRGEFYKKINREQYDQVMEYMHTVPNVISDFVRRMDPEGYYGKQWAAISQQLDPYSDGEEKDVLFLFDTIDLEAKKIIEKLLSNLKLLGQLLTGILVGDKGEFDTLSNFPDLSGPPHRQFKDELVTREFQVNNSWRNISDLFALEEKTRR